MCIHISHIHVCMCIHAYMYIHVYINYVTSTHLICFMNGIISMFQNGSLSIWGTLRTLYYHAENLSRSESPQREGGGAGEGVAIPCRNCVSCGPTSDIHVAGAISVSIGALIGTTTDATYPRTSRGSVTSHMYMSHVAHIYESSTRSADVVGREMWEQMWEQIPGVGFISSMSSKRDRKVYYKTTTNRGQRWLWYWKLLDLRWAPQQ